MFIHGIITTSVTVSPFRWVMVDFLVMAFKSWKIDLDLVCLQLSRVCPSSSASSIRSALMSGSRSTCLAQMECSWEEGRRSWKLDVTFTETGPQQFQIVLVSWVYCISELSLLYKWVELIGGSRRFLFGSPGFCWALPCCVCQGLQVHLCPQGAESSWSSGW